MSDDEVFVPTPGNVKALQEYALQVNKLAQALASDSALTEKVIVASRANQSSQVETLFQGIGVKSTVTVTEVKPADEAAVDGAVDPEAAKKANTFSINIDVGPVHISIGCSC